jgi:hypothetical protein
MSKIETNENDNPMCILDFTQDCSPKCKNFITALEITQGAAKSTAKVLSMKFSIPDFKAMARQGNELTIREFREIFKERAVRNYPGITESCHHKDNHSPGITTG